MTRSVSILDADQEESAGGGGGCGGGAVTQLKDALDICDSEAAFADHEKCSNEIANHMVEKSVAADGIDQFVAVALPLGVKDGADVVEFKSGFIDFKSWIICFNFGIGVESGIGFEPGFHFDSGFGIDSGFFCYRSLFVGCKNFFAFFRIDGGEAGEVMLAFDEGSGLDHARFIERIRMVVNIARLEWRANCSSIDVVAVSFGDSRAARMEIRRHFFRRKYSDGAWKYVI
jgi:hypothetical protein